MLRRWGFRLVPSERSLEAVGESVRLHIISRSKVFDMFPRTYRGNNRCVLRQKHALINSRERTRIWLHTRHQSGAIEPCGDGSIDVKEIKSSARKRRISGLFRRLGFEARLLKKLGFLIWKHIYCKMYVRL